MDVADHGSSGLRRRCRQRISRSNSAAPNAAPTPVLDRGEEAAGQRGELRVVADAERIGIETANRRRGARDRRLDIAPARLDAVREGGGDAGPVVGDRDDVKLRPVAFGGAVADFEPRSGPAIDRGVGVVAAGLGLPVPAQIEPDMDAAHRVAEPRVARVIEAVAGKGFAGHLAELSAGDDRRPALDRADPDIGAIVERLAGEQRVVDAVDEVGPDIGERVALLGHVEVPGRTRVGHAGNLFIRWWTLVISTAGASGEPGSWSPNTSGSAWSRRSSAPTISALPPIMSASTSPLASAASATRSSRGRSARRMIAGLSARTCRPGLDRRLDQADLVAVAAGQDADAAGFLVAQPVEVVGAGMDGEGPGGRIIRPRVEPRDTGQIVDEIETDRGVDMHLGQEARVHLLLHERGVEMPGVDDDKAAGHGLPSTPSCGLHSALASFGRGLRPLLGWGALCVASKSLLILRKPRGGCLEGRTRDPALERHPEVRREVHPDPPHQACVMVGNGSRRCIVAALSQRTRSPTRQ